jgi:hypothetical protein
VSFLRRILGGGQSDETIGRTEETAPVTAQEILADEQAHELEMLREDAARLDDLQQRQLRYADRAWTPPAQGGERRADDQSDAES